MQLFGLMIIPSFKTLSPPHLISSQLDVDRLDFLVRDSFFSGNKCGLIDAARLIFTLRIHNEEIVMQPKGRFAAEEFVLARYHIYWTVSFHKTTRGIELILKSAMERAKELSLPILRQQTFLYKKAPPSLNG